MTEDGVHSAGGAAHPVPDRALAGPSAPLQLLELPWQDAWPGGPQTPLVAVNSGYDARWERHALAVARDRAVPLLSVRGTSAEIQLGPLWSADGTSGCAGCAQVRDADRRMPQDARAPGRPSSVPTAEPAGRPESGVRAARSVLPPSVRPLLAGLLRQDAPLLTPGELLSLTAGGVLRRHRVAPSFRCAVCAGGRDLRTGQAAEPPPARTPAPRPTRAPIPDRSDSPPFGLDPGRMRDALADPRFGPVLRTQRDGHISMAVAEITLLGAMFAGYGRGSTYRRAEAVGYLEAFERIGGYPHTASIVFDASARELGHRALELAGLGHYTARQVASPLSKLRPFDEDTPMDWVWGHELDSGQPLLVPAEIGFYQYGYGVGPDQDARRTHFFAETSSGSALGGSYEEAALHSLMELAERDAFLLSWHSRRPLPRIDPADIDDRECRLLIRQIEDRGFDLHLLAATGDLGIPVVWALAIRPDGRAPSSLSAAGSGADPVQAVKSALWETAQVVDSALNWDLDSVRPAVADPWLVDEMLDHPKLYALPEMLPRVAEVLGGPTVSLAEAFPGWPGVFAEAAAADVTGALRFVAGLFAKAGLDRIVLVDQSTPVHTAAGLAAVKAVVPGIVPMCFGHAQQRLAGLDRLAGAFADAHGRPPREADFPLDPHPFP